MLAQWGFRIPVLVSVLGACSVYDASLLSSSPIVAEAGQAGFAGLSGGQAGSAGSSGSGASAGVDEPEAGAGGLSAPGGAAGTVAGHGGAAGSTSGAAGAGGTSGASGSASAGTGGGSSLSGAGGSAAQGGAATKLELELIDDMENGDTVIDATDSRGGDWYAGHDATATGTQFPGTPFVMSNLLAGDPRFASSKHAAMTNGMGFTDWGENLGFNLKLVNQVTGKHPIYDATAYCGVHFFAKVGAGATTKPLLRVIDKNSHPDGGICGGGGMPCYQYFQKQLTFSTAWQEQSVLFSELTCSGWPPKLELGAIFSVEFGLPSSSQFELWVDDVSFLKKPASGVCPKSL